MRRNSLASSKRPGKGQGCLIWDECKIVGKIAWNSKSREIYGLAASKEEFRSLHDIFLQEPATLADQPGEYVLQFVFRDLTSNFDILGPFWYSPQTMCTQFLYSCVHESLRTFHAFGFDVSVVVCDGASYNLTLLKKLCGNCTGPFGVGKWNCDPEDEFSVPVSFVNPFCPGEKIFVMPCPTHALKNWINALFQSHPGRTKGFKLRYVPNLICRNIEKDAHIQGGPDLVYQK